MRFANKLRRYLSAMREIVSPLDGFASPFGPQRGFNPLRLFANDEPGVWFEANDATTLFTDVAGTTPVTTPGDAVALQLDKSGRGNHRTQATVAARPLYALHPVGGVRNELVSTDTLATQDVTVTAAERTLSFKGTGTVTLSGASTAGPLVGTGADDIVSLTFTPTAGTLTLTVTGTVEEAQLELGAVRTNYQTVGSTFLDVSEEGKARRGRIWYNGTSHFMQTGTITPGTDKVQVFAGVRKLSVANTMVIAEISANADTNNGVFVLASVVTSGNSFFRSKGTIQADTNAVSSVAPITRLVSGLGDISGNRTTLRVDGVQVAQSVGDQGTGNYLAYPLYFGARAGTSLFYNGYEDTSIIRFGPNLDDTTISKVESYVASKTPEETI